MSWREVSGNLPTRFRLPDRRPRARARDDLRGADQERLGAFPPDGKLRVYRSRDRRQRMGGADRRAAAAATATSTSCAMRWRSIARSCGIYFGTTGGQVYASADCRRHLGARSCAICRRCCRSKSRRCHDPRRAAGPSAHARAGRAPRCGRRRGPATQRLGARCARGGAIPMLRGTIRDHVTRRRRPFVRFFACGEDLSHAAPDTPLPRAVRRRHRAVSDRRRDGRRLSPDWPTTIVVVTTTRSAARPPASSETISVQLPAWSGVTVNVPDCGALRTAAIPGVVQAPASTRNARVIGLGSGERFRRRRADIGEREGLRSERCAGDRDRRLRREIVEHAWSAGIVLHVGGGIVVEHRVRREVIQVRKRIDGARVPPAFAGEVVEVDPVLAVVRVDDVFVSHVEVVDVRGVGQIRVVAERRPVRQREVRDTVVERRRPVEERRMRGRRGAAQAWLRRPCRDRPQKRRPRRRGGRRRRGRSGERAGRGWDRQRAAAGPGAAREGRAEEREQQRRPVGHPPARSSAGRPRRGARTIRWGP